MVYREKLPVFKVMPRNTITHPQVITCLFWRCWDVVIQVEVRSDTDMTSHMVLFRTMGFRRTGMSCAASGPHHRPILDVMQSTARWRSLRKIKINRIYFKNSIKPLQVLTCTIMIKIDCRLFNFPKKISRFRSNRYIHYCRWRTAWFYGAHGLWTGKSLYCVIPAGLDLSSSIKRIATFSQARQARSTKESPPRGIWWK